MNLFKINMKLTRAFGWIEIMFCFGNELVQMDFYWDA